MSTCIKLQFVASLIYYMESSLFHLRSIHLNEIKHCRTNVTPRYENVNCVMKWILTTVNGIPITWNRCNVRAIKAELKEFHSCILIMYPRVGRIANIVVSQTEIWQKSIRFLFPITSGCRHKLSQICETNIFLQISRTNRPMKVQYEKFLMEIK